jgi:hypothetical protein
VFTVRGVIGCGIRATGLLVGLALGSTATAWTLAPFLTAPWHLDGAGPVTAVLSACAWLLLACLGWLVVGVLVTLHDVLRTGRPARPRILAPAALRRLVVVVVGVGLSGSVAGMASAQPPAPSPASGTAPGSAVAGLDGLVVPDRVEDGPAVWPSRTPFSTPPPASGPRAPAVPAPTPGPTAQATPQPTPQPSTGSAPRLVPGAAPGRTPGATDGQRPRPPAPPATEPARPSPAPAPPEQTVVVRPGDSLWRIAARLSPAPAQPALVDSAWRRIYAVNRPPLGADPDLIHPGDVLRIPRALTADRTPADTSPDTPADTPADEEPR